MEELRKLVQAHPEAAVFSEMTRESALNTLLAMNMDAFVDPETGACSFDSQEFIQLLELVKTFPEEIDWEKLYNADPMYWEKCESQYREGRTLLMQTYVSSYTSIRNVYYYFDSDCTYIGYPGAKGSGAVIQPNMEIAISGRTKLDDQCWDFVRYLLSEQYQSEIESWTFPVRLDALKAMEEQAMSDTGYGGMIYYSTANGGGIAVEETMVYDETQLPETEADEDEGEGGDGENATDGDLEPLPAPVPVEPGYDDWWSKPLTQDMVDKITAVVKGAVQVYRQQTEVMAIIQEEAGAFFAGQKSAQAVAEVIQSRVSLYEAESR